MPQTRQGRTQTKQLKNDEISCNLPPEYGLGLPAARTWLSGPPRENDNKAPLHFTVVIGVLPEFWKMRRPLFIFVRPFNGGQGNEPERKRMETDLRPPGKGRGHEQKIQKETVVLRCAVQQNVFVYRPSDFVVFLFHHGLTRSDEMFKIPPGGYPGNAELFRCLD